MDEVTELRQEVRQLRLLVKGACVVLTLWLALMNVRAITVLSVTASYMETLTNRNSMQKAFAYGKAGNGSLPWVVTGLLTVAAIFAITKTRRSSNTVLGACATVSLLVAHWAWLSGIPELIVDGAFPFRAAF